ncbi:MAG TPA: class I SAM-dependent methyltransferase [Candidatus Bipolaricaulota bacterium]|nr:class I SAM-dependent methyltransferase [Candidatus Bipolaricaulota bacterium]
MKEICGDNFSGNKLTVKDRIIYLFYNLFRGIWGYRKRLKMTYWRPIDLIPNSASPGRQFLDNFLEHKLPELILKKEIKVLDIGCGSGYVRKILADAGYVVDYTGIDVFKNDAFDQYSKYCQSKFFQTAIESFETDDKFDLIISISALEHIKNDSLAVEKSGKALNQGGVQIHIVPSFWVLPLYLWHGYRQYTPIRIKKLFNEKFEVFKFGGFFLSDFILV